jgi:hypothetical protein
LTAPVIGSSAFEVKHNGHDIDPTTLLVASVSSAAAAVVVHELWRAGTIVGAAATPILVALFAEFLNRPAQRVRTTRIRTAGFDLPTRPLAVTGDETIRIYRSRPRWARALAIGLAAFALGAAGLTVSETLLQRSLADGGTRPTLLDSAPDRSSPATRAPTSREHRQFRTSTDAHKRPADSSHERRQHTPKSDRRGGGEAKPTPTPTPSPVPSPTPVGSPTPDPTPPGGQRVPPPPF